MRFGVLILFLLVAVPLTAQEDQAEDPEPDYSRKALRELFLEIEAPVITDPFKAGFPLFEFTIGGTKSTVRFVPVGMPFGAGSVTLNPIPDPLALTGNAGSAISPRMRSRYTEWWTNRKLGFPISPPAD